MSKIIRRTLIVIMIFVLVFEFSFSNTSYAAIELKNEDITLISNLIGGIVSLLIWIPKLLTTALLWFFSNTVLLGIASTEGSTGTITTLTPFDIFFGHFNILSLDFFDIQAGSSSVNNKLRTGVATWFIVLRNISLVILVLILIYVGIRMALSTVASEKVRYRKMLYDWFCSLLLVFVLQYLAIFLIELNKAIVAMLAEMIGTADGLGDAIESIINQSLVGVGFTAIMAFLVYVIIIVQTILFFIAYFNRVLKVAFLIIVSPLISITYSIDKMGDGKAQALEAWLKEFVYTIFIQPFHCIMYIAFVSAAASLMVTDPTYTVGGSFSAALDPSVNQLTNGVLTILCLKFINDGEKIIRKIFNFQDDNSTTSMAAGTALAVMAVQKAKQAKAVGKNFKNSALGKAAKHDIGMLAQKYQGFGKLKDTLDKNFKEGKSPLGKLHRTITGVKGMKDKVFSKPGLRLASKMSKKSTAAVLSAMGAAAMYATGSEGALESFAAGKRMYSNRMQRMNATKSSAAQMGAPSNDIVDEMEKEDNDQVIEDTTRRLQELGVTEEDASDFEKLEEQATEAEQRTDAVRKSAAKKKREERIADIDKQLASLSASSPDYKKLKEERKQLLNTPIQKEELEKVENEPEVVAAREESDKAREIATVARERADAIKTKKEYDTPEARIARAKRRSRAISEGEFESQKTRIAYLISQIKKRRELDEEDADKDVYTENELLEMPDDSSERTAARIANTIQHGVLMGSNFNVRDFMRDSLGITDYDDPSSLGYALMGAIQQYNYLAHLNNIAQSYKAASTAGSTKDDHAERLVAAGKNGLRAPRETQTNESSM